MTVAIQILCDECGRRTMEAVCDGTAPKKEIGDLRRSNGWQHFKPKGTAATRDVCPVCMEEKGAVQIALEWGPEP